MPTSFSWEAQKSLSIPFTVSASDTLGLLCLNRIAGLDITAFSGLSVMVEENQWVLGFPDDGIT